MPTPPSPPVTVIVPVRNGAATIGRVLDALACNPRELYEAVVVDDRSTDDTAAVARAHGARVIENTRGDGPAAARNLGAESARGRILLFIDADVEVRRDTIRRFLAMFDADPALTAVFGSYDDEPAAANFASQYRNLLHHFVHQTSDRQSASFWAGCGAIRRDAFLAVGGFDELRYQRPATEDIELGRRLWRAGHHVRLAAEIQVKHLKAWSGLSMMRADIMDRAVPWSWLLLDHGSIPSDLNLRWSHRLSAGLVALLAAALVFLALGHQRFYGVPARGVAAVAAVVLVAQLIPLNRGFYLFLLRQRGWVFTIRAIPLHFLYYFYSGLTFSACWLWHMTRSSFSRRRRAAAAGLGPSLDA